MEIRRLHDWQLNTTEAIELQRHLAGQVSASRLTLSPRYIAGVDVSVRRGEATATGSILVQAIAGGYLGSLDEGRSIVRSSQEIRVFEPVADPHWDRSYICYQSLDTAD